MATRVPYLGDEWMKCKASLESRTSFKKTSSEIAGTNTPVGISVSNSCGDLLRNSIVPSESRSFFRLLNLIVVEARKKHSQFPARRYLSHVTPVSHSFIFVVCGMLVRTPKIESSLTCVWG